MLSPAGHRLWMTGRLSGEHAYLKTRLLIWQKTTDTCSLSCPFWQPIGSNEKTHCTQDN
jgi:hypothetical protein